MADGTVCDDIKGKGNVVIATYDSQGKPYKINLQGVLYMPSCDHTGIISVNRVTESGGSVHFVHNGSYMIYNGVKIPLMLKDKLLHIQVCNADLLLKDQHYSGIILWAI